MEFCAVWPIAMHDMKNMNNFNLVLERLQADDKYTRITANKWGLISLFSSQRFLRSWSKKHLGWHPRKEIRQNLGVYVKSCAIGSLRNSDEMLPDSEGTGAVIHDIKTFTAEWL